MIGLPMDSTLKELDVVALVKDLPEHALRRGSVGTIVHVHSPAPGRPPAYEVEFVDRDGKTYALVTLQAQDVLQLHFELSAA